MSRQRSGGGAWSDRWQQRDRRPEADRRVQQWMNRQRTIAEAVVSVAGLARRPIRDSQGADVGRVADVVVRADSAEYPPVIGLVARVGFRRVFIPAEYLGTVRQREVQLASTRIDLRDYVRRPGEMLLVHDVLDHQLVDVDGVRVVRAADVYLTVNGACRLVAVDVSVVSLLRRVLPGSAGRRPTPMLVIDWASVQPFGQASGKVQLRRPHEGLHQLRPAELADLLEELGHSQQQEVLAALEAETAADVLEEMEPAELEALLRDVPRPRAADLLARMEPDEAVDALRDLPEQDRAELLQAMPADVASGLGDLLAYPESEAGGWMTTHLVRTLPTDSVAEARRRTVAERAHRDDIDGVVVVDAQGHLVDHVSLFELLDADPDAPMADLVAPPWPATVPPEADLSTVVERLTANRRSSLLVVDEQDRPLGRILADDVVDALAGPRSRRWPWQSHRTIG